MKKTALIGFTGYVGSNIIKQKFFDEKYRSNNINKIDGKNFDLIVSAACPGKKWLANKDPKKDFDSINLLMKNLEKVIANEFILISTVDVFPSPIKVNEYSEIEKNLLLPYGLHRKLFEEFVLKNFKNSRIIRLPGLVGPELRKNILYDFKHNNNLHLIDDNSIFQYYPIQNLWKDIEIIKKSNLKLIHITSEPIKVKEIARECFGINFENKVPKLRQLYDFRSVYTKQFGKNKNYQYKKGEILNFIKKYSQ